MYILMYARSTLPRTKQNQAFCICVSHVIGSGVRIKQPSKRLETDPDLLSICM